MKNIDKEILKYKFARKQREIGRQQGYQSILFGLFILFKGLGYTGILYAGYLYFSTYSVRVLFLIAAAYLAIEFTGLIYPRLDKECEDEIKKLQKEQEAL